MSTIESSTILNTFVDKFNNQCTEYFNSKLHDKLLNLSPNDKIAASEYYLTEYQRCIDEQMNFINYVNEQNGLLDELKSSEVAIDRFLQRLKEIYEYEIKQNEIFENILHELTKINSSSKVERVEILGQIDELIACKAKLMNTNDDNKLTTKSSDTFKTIL